MELHEAREVDDDDDDEMPEVRNRANEYWKKHEEESKFALYTPFFVCLAAGNLDLESFRHCISQDLHFFSAFYEVYLKAEFCADDIIDKQGINYLKEYVQNKLHTYQTVVQDWGLELPNLIGIIHPTTVNYRKLLRSLAYDRPSNVRDAAYILAAIAPYMRLYCHICHIISQTIQNPDNFSPIYNKWLQYYTSDHETKVLAKKTENALDSLSVSLTRDHEHKVTEYLYGQAMKFQLQFFASLPISQPTVVPLSRVLDLNKSQLTIFSDFDMTCLHGDFTTMLAIIKSAFSPRSSAYYANSVLELLSTGYKKGLVHCMKSIITGTPGKVFDYKVLVEALKQVAEYEKMANEMLEGSGVLKGVSLDRIKQVGQDIKLHKGCRKFFHKIVKRGNPKIDVHVISYCWCGDLIRSAFSSDLEALNIHSNELAYKESTTTGKIDKKVESPSEKLHVLREVLEGHKSISTEGKHLRVYIGGAVGDLLCLVEADIGIVFGASESLKKLGMHFGVSFVPLLHGVVKNQMENGKWKSQYGILYTVDSWAEIQAFILGL